MTKLKLASVQEEKPVKFSVAVPAALHRDLVAYAEILSRESGKPIEASKLIAPMLEKFIASDREFARRGARRVSLIRSLRHQSSRRSADFKRARLRKRRSAGLSLPGSQTTL